MGSYFLSVQEFDLLWFVSLQIDENVAREIINHRSLRHPNIIRFKEARLSFFLFSFFFPLTLNN